MAASASGLENQFLNPPDSARPGVYWYFLDGNLNGREMTADLESMKAAGLGNLVFLEVDIGDIARGPVAFMSPKWQELFVQSVRDAERLGIDITLGIGPDWCGSGGPWVKPEQAMQHLVFSSVDLKGPQGYSAILPLPATPFFPASGPANRSFNGLHPKSKFLAFRNPLFPRLRSGQPLFQRPSPQKQIPSILPRLFRGDRQLPAGQLPTVRFERLPETRGGRRGRQGNVGALLR